MRQCKLRSHSFIGLYFSLLRRTCITRRSANKMFPIGPCVTRFHERGSPLHMACRMIWRWFAGFGVCIIQTPRNVLIPLLDI